MEDKQPMPLWLRRALLMGVVNRKEALEIQFFNSLPVEEPVELPDHLWEALDRQALLETACSPTRH